MQTFIHRTIIFFFIVLKMGQSHAQDCIFKEPFLTIDFGSGKNIPNSDFTPPYNYQRASNSCPQDGFYSFVSYTSACFANDWFTLEDHTPNDKEGNMMLVNAAETGGIFFTAVLDGMKPYTTYQLAAWMLNVCRIGGGCSPLPPNITITLLTPGGVKVALFQTGLLQQSTEPHWKKYFGSFTTPANVTSLVLTMDDITIGGCGNDFALDDITLQECVKPVPEIKPEAKPQNKPVEKPAPPVTNPVVKKVPPKANPVKNNPPVLTIEKQRIDSPVIHTPVIKEKLVQPVPAMISTRANPLIKQIETAAGEIVINLYDNGEIDGDTVTVYHNNELIVSRAGLSTTPVTFRIKVDKANPHHELIMVANNLGSIPPNTSLMIITANNKRYQVFISSSEQKNARIVIDLAKGE